MPQPTGPKPGETLVTAGTPWLTYEDLCGRDPLGFAVAINHADALLRVNVAEQTGSRRLRFAVGVSGGDDEVLERFLPIGIGPNGLDDLAGHGEGTEHPGFDPAQALGPVVGQPLGQGGELLGQVGLFQLLGHGSELLAGGIAANQFAGVDAESVALVGVEPGDGVGWGFGGRFCGAERLGMVDSGRSSTRIEQGLDAECDGRMVL